MVARDSLARVRRDVLACVGCPRLRQWCREVASVKVKRFRDHDYCGQPVPGFGDPDARLLVVGLAPAAHGANRTGRVFTGDRSGDFLFAALHRAGFANQPTSVARDDGLKLEGCYVTAAARCAPPANRPTTEELRRCGAFLRRELSLLPRLEVTLALGAVAMKALLGVLREQGRVHGRQARAFGHGLAHDLGDGFKLFASYHPSQQNTFTGRLTAEGFDAVLRDVNRHLGRSPHPERKRPRRTRR